MMHRLKLTGYNKDASSSKLTWSFANTTFLAVFRFCVPLISSLGERPDDSLALYVAISFMRWLSPVLYIRVNAKPEPPSPA